MSERRLLQSIAVLVAVQLIVQVVPGPFRQCTRRDTGLTEPILGMEAPVYVTECVDSWWPIGARGIGWLPPTAVPVPTLAPGQAPLAP